MSSLLREIGNALNWFEIPVLDFERAKKFYETIFNYQMPENQMGPARMGFLLFDFPNGKVGGAIVCNPEFYTPQTNSVLVYLNCQPDLQIDSIKFHQQVARFYRKKKKFLLNSNWDFGHWYSTLKETALLYILWDKKLLQKLFLHPIFPGKQHLHVFIEIIIKTPSGVDTAENVA